MMGLVIRIALRYIAAFLIARGVLSDEFGTTLASDADVISMIEMALGALSGIAAEVWLYADRHFGGSK